MIKGFQVRLISDEDVEISVTARLPRLKGRRSDHAVSDETHRALVAEIDRALARLLPGLQFDLEEE